MLVSRTLRQAGYGDHEIVEAGDGLEALGVIRSEPVDVVLCDWNMPRMTGLELLQSLRGAGDLRLFGFITSESTPAMRGMAEQQGAAFVISKPFTAATFQSVLGGMDVRDHAAIVHEGLPVVADLESVLATLLGREVTARASQHAVGPEQAAVRWGYTFPDGRLAAAGMLDLPLAAGLATGFARLPTARLTDALHSGHLPDDLMENLAEVLNVLVSLYSSMSDQRMVLSSVLRAGEHPPEVQRVLEQQRARLDAAVRMHGYGEGLMSLAYADPR